MTKAQLIDNVAKKLGSDQISKKAIGEIIDLAFNEVAAGIRRDKRFSFPDFGTFTVKARKARKGRNPRTGEEIKIKASKAVGFKAAPALKKVI
jgi:DNA-binding protein HU-beta